MEKRKTIHDIVAMKGKEAICSLTAYDTVTATLLDRAGCDIILVGDSLGNVVLGYPDTLEVTMSDMLRHASAVARGSKTALLVADMPFLSYQTDRSQALTNAGTLIATAHMQAIKLEGGKRNSELISNLVDIGIPVMGHIGITPQSRHTIGRFHRVGKTADESSFLIEEALAVEKAGAFAVVLECIQPEVAATITQELKIPTIGIGCGPDCDGQILVINDLLGYCIESPPAFVKPAVNLATLVSETVGNFVSQLKASS